MLEGEISEIDLVARLVELWREQFTGAIRFENDGIIKIVYFKGGDILSASTNDRSDSIDEILMRAGKISREHVKQALAKRKESETLGDALLNLGFITRKELTWARRVQVVGVIRSIAAWTEGSFTIVADYLPKRDEGTLFPLPQVLVELVVTDQDRARFERALDGGSAVFAKTADFDDVFRRLGLNEDAEAITTQIDGAKSAADVATASRRDTFNAYKLIHALATLGILTRVDRTPAQPEFAVDDFASAGVADAAEMLDEPAPAPRFEFDEAEALRQPTLEVPAMSYDDPPAQTASAWDEPEETAVPEPPARMPSWDTPTRAVPLAAAAMSAKEIANVPVNQEEDDEQWGFDEAQIETAQRATAARAGEPPAAPEGGRRYGLLLALMVIFILAAAGYFGFRWWQGREDAASVASVNPTPAPRRPRVPRANPAATMTIEPVTETMATITDTTGTAAGTTSAATATIATSTAATTITPTTPVATTTAAAKPPAPMQITATRAPEPAPTQALPAVVPRQSSNRYDTMARDYLATATGNFTVQIQILCETSNLDKAIQTGGSNVWFVPQPIGTRSCYRLFWGHYATRDEAQRALPTIPASMRDRSSAVKPVPKK
jgi:uncharacterized protein DUF4388